MGYNTTFIIVTTETPAPTVPVCQQEKEIGPCRALIPRWFYNGETGQCESFNYGGCRGNQNNFESATECETQCARRSKLVSC